MVRAAVLEEVLPGDVVVEFGDGDRIRRIRILVVRASHSSFYIGNTDVHSAIRCRHKDLGIVVDALTVANLPQCVGIFGIDAIAAGPGGTVSSIRSIRAESQELIGLTSIVGSADFQTRQVVIDFRRS